MVNIGHPFEARMWSRKAGAWSRHISIFEHTQLRSMLHLLLRPSRAQLAGSKKKERTIVTILYDTAILLFRPCPRRNLLGNTKCHGTNIDLEQRSCFSRGTDSQRWWSINRLHLQGRPNPGALRPQPLLFSFLGWVRCLKWTKPIWVWINTY